MMALIELAKKPDELPEWTPERREQFLQRVLARAEADRERRRVRRAFAAGAFAVLVGGLLIRLISIGAPVLIRSAPELAAKMVWRHMAAE